MDFVLCHMTILYEDIPSYLTKIKKGQRLIKPPLKNKWFFQMSQKFKEIIEYYFFKLIMTIKTKKKYLPKHLTNFNIAMLLYLTKNDTQEV